MTAIAGYVNCQLIQVVHYILSLVVFRLQKLHVKQLQVILYFIQGFIS